MTRRPCAEALAKYGQSLNVKALTAELARIDDEREEMLGLLKSLVAKIIDYERVNNLAPNEGRQYCWDEVAKAVVIIEKIERRAA